MNRTAQARIDRLVGSGFAGSLAGGMKGIEKESLRVTPDGELSQRAHPESLGSAMTNRFITTDFSEALLEFVTPAYTNTWETLRVLCEIHQFSYQCLEEELLWVASMPCLMATDGDIPLAQYGDSNVGTMKTVYRNGLGYRYGRKMQTIAGVHFNYSLPEAFWPDYKDLEKSALDDDDFRSEAYMGLVRNFRRMGWLILYLFGASPALCKSFFGDKTAHLQSFDASTCYEPFATSLRMSDLGYSNNTQAKLQVSVNSLAEYIVDLNCAICTPEARYEEIGVKVDGSYRQLNANLLQIENEFYSSIRPKRVARSGERPTTALRRCGVEYVEVRSLDLNLFDPVGINQNAMRFVEAFLVYCLLSDSNSLDESGAREAASNLDTTAKRGRDPDAQLIRDGREVALRDWAAEIVTGVREVAKLIDSADSAGQAKSYVEAVDVQMALVEDSDETPSARILRDMRQSDACFFDYAMDIAKGHKEYFSNLVPLDGERSDLYTSEAAASQQRQAEIEAADELSFEQYLALYYSKEGCVK